MKYSFVVAHSAVKDLKKLDPVIRARIQKKLQFYQDQAEPLSFAVPLAGKGIVGDFRFRVGEYRILCDANKNTIIIRSIKHRRESYRKKT